MRKPDILLSNNKTMNSSYLENQPPVLLVTELSCKSPLFFFSMRFILPLQMARMAWNTLRTVEIWSRADFLLTDNCPCTSCHLPALRCELDVCKSCVAECKYTSLCKYCVHCECLCPYVCCIVPTWSVLHILAEGLQLCFPDCRILVEDYGTA